MKRDNDDYHCQQRVVVPHVREDVADVPDLDVVEVRHDLRRELLRMFLIGRQIMTLTRIPTSRRPYF